MLKLSTLLLLCFTTTLAWSADALDIAATGDATFTETVTVKKDLTVEGVLNYTVQPLVFVHAGDANAQLVSTSTNLTYTSEVLDDYTCWSVDTFTAPRTGIYMLSATSCFNHTSPYSIGIWKNGTHVMWGATAERTTYAIVAVSGIFRLQAGDTLNVRSSVAGTKFPATTHNQIQIVEMR